MTLISALKNMTPTSSLGMSNSSIASAASSFGMQSSNKSAGLLDCVGGLLSGIHVDANVDANVNLAGCNILTAHIDAHVN
ncbi:hypothetical protein SAMD00019534_080140 [Acytostelium subglobosum LB1]|uniref:hypothetical protein n=1 Tax=Acytostelium subglobosum LB1 TaxID=1410327 RepID=UPI000644DF80|nr:hypothetical protein SAMD00019534_080140 [Acytostelium subglobosum LB1]GAM24839.1 hypothetical protein SAMD00019534_080140 [Acytostelium subglobosum LB1]|eukprot:XP_012752508.1 hypothetical protein SAMD00019534_080140 [Acytostelium subglobosum LB1]